LRLGHQNAEQLQGQPNRNKPYGTNPNRHNNKEQNADRARRALGLPTGKPEPVHVPLREILAREAELAEGES